MLYLPLCLISPSLHPFVFFTQLLSTNRSVKSSMGLHYIILCAVQHLIASLIMALVPGANPTSNNRQYANRIEKNISTLRQPLLYLKISLDIFQVHTILSSKCLDISQILYKIECIKENILHTVTIALPCY